jgi:probable HAF family extracellular repeat protein
MDESGNIAWWACGHEDPWAWLSQGNSWTALGGLRGGGGHSWVNSMNEHLQIVGTSGAVYTGESPWPYDHAFIWDNGAMQDLGQLGVKPCRTYPDRNCSYANALSINESGQVTGYSTAADGSVHAVLWENGKVRDLWKPTGSDPYPWRGVINDAGQVAGSSSGEAFVWSDGQLYALGSLGGGGTQVVDMNEAGAVAGTSHTTLGEQHVFVWTKERGMIDLGTGPHGFNTAWVVGISFDGDIAGYTAQCALSCRYSEDVRAVMWRHP